MDDLDKEIRLAHRLCAVWESQAADGWSPATYRAKLRAFAGPALQRALAEGRVVVETAPRFVRRDGGRG